MDTRTALVLGGTKGLGRGCADALADKGFNVAVCSRSQDDIDEAVAALSERGVKVTGLATDVTDPAQLEALFDHIATELGKVSVLVANAGGPPPGSILDLDDDKWRTGFELTFMSAVRSIRLAVPHMRESGYGRIVIIGSSSVRQPLPNLGLSNAFRPALVGVMKSLAIDLAPEHITANLVSPGRIATDRVRQPDGAAAQRQGKTLEEVQAASRANIRMGEHGQPEDLGALVAFLASPEARYITGQTILVDGGLVRSLH